jgi:hypothetical protein
LSKGSPPVSPTTRSPFDISKRSSLSTKPQDISVFEVSMDLSPTQKEHFKLHLVVTDKDNKTGELKRGFILQQRGNNFCLA